MPSDYYDDNDGGDDDDNDDYDGDNYDLGVQMNPVTSFWQEWSRQLFSHPPFTNDDEDGGCDDGDDKDPSPHCEMIIMTVMMIAMNRLWSSSSQTVVTHNLWSISVHLTKILILSEINGGVYGGMMMMRLVNSNIN